MESTGDESLRGRFKMTSHILVSICVAATPARAFDVFTGEIGVWWQPNALFRFSRKSPGHLRFEPGPDGRLIEILPGGEIFEIGRITSWGRECGLPLRGPRRLSRQGSSPMWKCDSSRSAPRHGLKSSTPGGTRSRPIMSPAIIFQTRFFCVGKPNGGNYCCHCTIHDCRMRRLTVRRSRRESWSELDLVASQSTDSP